MPISLYIPRLADAKIEQYLDKFPALLITGPRATGKTTTARRHAKTIIRLDSPADAAAFRADPDSALRSLPEPVLLDEWQSVPEILGAVKRSVDDNPRPGRFIVTGSVRGDLDAPIWPGTGRLLRIQMYGLCQCELSGILSGATLVEKLATARIEDISVPADTPDLRGYIQLALRGGFPEVALEPNENDRLAWLNSYIDFLITRDASELVAGRDPELLRRYFEISALSTAGTPNLSTLALSANISRHSAAAYDALLTNLLILDLVPAWTNNRLHRLIRSPKRYLVDSSLVAAILDVDEAGVIRDGELMERLIDTFTVAQIRAESAFSQRRFRIFHLRDANGRHEIDLIAEFSGGSIVAIEIKASAAPKLSDAKHLLWLRDSIGDKFLAGAVLHTGPRPYRMEERIFAIPISALWGPS